MPERVPVSLVREKMDNGRQHIFARQYAKAKFRFSS
jgi:hypothetical protein